MGDQERTVLDFYGISNPYPVEWPAEKDKEEVPDEENDPKSKLQRRKSRYQALQRATTRASIVPGSENSGSGKGNLVQRDEPDPLGTTDSVVSTLRQQGLPLQDDPKLRNRFLLSSTTFSPALFLSQMHANADTQSLLYGLETLSKSIDQKSASLKVLVESNFERFVRAKATIDNVYKEMKFRGAEPTPPRARAHSRHASRNSFRSSGGAGMGLVPPLSPVPDARKKNALIKESDYGVMGIKNPLLEVSAKAEDLWGPALWGRDKEEKLKAAVSSIERYKDIVETSASIADSIKRKDHETLVEEYSKARRFVDDTKQMVQQIGNGQPNDEQLCQVLIAARMWHDADEQIQAFRRDVWKRLVSLNNISRSDSPQDLAQDQHMELISLLLELGVEDNPIWVWLLSRYDFLKGKIQSTAERSKLEIEVCRRQLASAEKPSHEVTAHHMRSLERHTVERVKMPSFDSPDIVELWEKMAKFLTNMLSTQGIVGEVVEFWQTVQGFIDGKIQRNLPNGFNGESQKHHRLSDQVTNDLRKGTVELTDMIREHILMFFAGPPPEDISALISPLPQSPGTPASASMNGSMTPTALRGFSIDPDKMPPMSPTRGEAWEKFAFWPPWSNSISGVHYLSKMLVLVGSGASDMASIGPVGRDDPSEVERLKSLVGIARERCVVALCAAWNRDAENIKYVEDWTRSPDRRDVTKMPVSFASFEGRLLAGMQRILYISEAMSKPGAGDIVSPPQPKLLQMARSQYVTTLYKALSGMVENAERSVKRIDDEWVTDMDSVAISGPPPGLASTAGGGTVNIGDRHVRMLLTLSNLQCLRSEVVPSLNSQFENAFSVKLTDETKTIKDVLGQIDAQLFQSYTRPSIETLRKIIRVSVTAADWVPQAGVKPREARPYVYEVLLSLVLVHSQVSTTASSLTSQVLSYLLEQTSRELLEAFRTRPKYSLEALMQATLDVEFIAQTLAQYTTDRAAELQSQIYAELDSRTDNDARSRLQSELPEMRSVLKRLREASKSEFACFKKPKRSAGLSGSQPGGPLSRRDTGGSVSSQ